LKALLNGLTGPGMSGNLRFLFLSRWAPWSLSGLISN
jgi:hypothetical protein